MGKAATIAIMISVVAVTALFISVYSSNMERIDETKQDMISAGMNMLDVCVSAKSLGDIVLCDEQIPSISNTCSEYVVQDCAAKINAYYETRDSRITRAQTELNAAFRDMLQSCVNNDDIMCDDSLSRIIDYCQRYSDTIAYVESCNETQIFKKTTFQDMSAVDISSARTTTTASFEIEFYQDLTECKLQDTTSCIITIGQQYEKCLTDKTYDFCNDAKVISFILLKNIRFEDNKAVLIHDEPLRELYSWGIYFEGSSYDPRQVIKELNIEYNKDPNDITNTSLSILDYCLTSGDRRCSAIMSSYARSCEEILHPLCNEEKFAYYLIKENLIPQILTK